MNTLALHTGNKKVSTPIENKEPTKVLQTLYTKSIQSLLLLNLLDINNAAEAKLHVGWNLTTPIIHAPIAVDEYLETSGIPKERIEKIWKYDGGWTQWGNAKKDFETLHPNQGYWFLINQGESIEYTHPETMLETSFTTKQGWNLKGNSLSQNIEMNSMVQGSSDATALKKVWAYSEENNTLGWKAFSPDLPNEGLQSLKPGYGMWILSHGENSIQIFGDEIRQKIENILPKTCPGCPPIGEE